MKTFSDIERNPDAKTLVSFRWVLLGGGAFLWLVLRFAAHKPRAAVTAAAIAAGLALLSAVPGLGRRVYVLWMGLGIAIGMVTTPIILGVVWFLVFTPIGFVMRLLGHDPMKRAKLPPGATGWERHAPPGDLRSYFRQF